MAKILKSYTFKGFGFDVLLKNVSVKSIDGEEYPEIKIRELKNDTAKALLRSRQRLTGHQLKFLRTYLKMSFDEVAAKLHIPSSTLRSWEKKGTHATGLSLEQEKAFRILVTNQLLDQEKSTFNIELTLVEKFQEPAVASVLDISSNLNSFVV